MEIRAGVESEIMQMGRRREQKTGASRGDVVLDGNSLVCRAPASSHRQDEASETSTLRCLHLLFPLEGEKLILDKSQVQP